MTSSERVQAFQAKLDGIADERAARNELTGKRVTESLTRQSEQNEKFLRTVGSVALRMNERHQQTKDSVGWPTPHDHSEPGDTEHSFGFEEDPDFPGEPTEPPVPAREGHHAAPEPTFDEDFSNTNWLR